ncbi:uncharacterized protein C24B11.05-like isoform X2 [Phalaenopsis equestris]|uniref:uncharacterized protein C24B11.05-like isoform X2 n=1 Tax=Phalaenopsis equestris TaxID=78828 RepID=UPI0009E20565|nr:uncharacterized protein C24B11.05-like isoform X2 [Phalaenopsis equestris]
MAYEDLYHKDLKSKVDCLIFEYMVEKLGIEKSKVSELCNLLYKNYGTTMAGLRAIGYSFNYDDYHSFVHGRLPYEKLKPDPILKHLLLGLPIRKVIFTNADKVHAARVLSRLGLEDCFEGIICFESLNDPNCESCCATKLFDILEHSARPIAGVALPKTPVLCKPSESAMELALKLANIDPKRAIFFDDSVRNIQAAKRIGLGTVLVGYSHGVKGADHVLESIHNIREALSEFWEEDEKSEDVLYQNNIAIATTVTA